MLTQGLMKAVLTEVFGRTMLHTYPSIPTTFGALGFGFGLGYWDWCLGGDQNVRGGLGHMGYRSSSPGRNREDARERGPHRPLREDHGHSHPYDVQALHEGDWETQAAEVAHQRPEAWR